MLTRYTPAANLAVRDLAVSRHFYTEILGFVLLREHPTLLILRCGSAVVLVYLSPYAGTNQATALTWSVGPELPGVIAALRSRGVTFEHYPDLPGLTVEGDLHTGPGEHGEPFGIAWFRDPDGNILSLTSSSENA